MWRAPNLQPDLGGGKLALWCEQGRPRAKNDATPWLVLHGGPGGRLHAGTVEPLRRVGVPWWGFDQRNSGLSDDLPLQDLDTQRLIDDIFLLADLLDVRRFNILAGSWGATLAIAAAAFRPDRIASMVLRGPFIPLRIRVDSFFNTLAACDPEGFTDVFGSKRDTRSVTHVFQKGTPIEQLQASLLWSRLEHQLLGMSAPTVGTLNDTDRAAVLRKYRLQAHFLAHDCFISPDQWACDVSVIAQHQIPITVVQGMVDKVCPPGGARFLSEVWPFAELIELPTTGHLGDNPAMVAALADAIVNYTLPRAKVLSIDGKRKRS